MYITSRLLLKVGHLPLLHRHSNKHMPCITKTTRLSIFSLLGTYITIRTDMDESIYGHGCIDVHPNFMANKIKCTCMIGACINRLVV
jgi:hypothetical protein